MFYTTEFDWIVNINNIQKEFSFYYIITPLIWDISILSTISVMFCISFYFNVTTHVKINIHVILFKLYV